MALLSEVERSSILPALLANGWTLVEGRDALCKTVRMPSFTLAVALYTAVACHSERLNHHPEWRNVYDRVEVVWSTHDATGLTQKDITMAGIFDELCQQLGGKA